MSDGNGNLTFVGPGFGTVLHAAVRPRSERPRVVSRRATLRRGLPAVYHDEDLTMRFVEALETVLDPIVAILDTLPQHFSPDYAPRPVLDLISTWLGVEVDESQALEGRRETVRSAAELGRRRGTVKGMELALRLGFPDVPMRVQDEGGVRWSLDGTPSPADPPRFIVYVDVPVPDERLAAIARTIERQKPVEATYRLRVKSAKKSQ